MFTYNFVSCLHSDTNCSTLIWLFLSHSPQLSKWLNNCFNKMEISSVFLLKGNLWYKTITSQNLSSEAQIFLFCRKIMFRSRNIQSFVFLSIPWFTESVTSQQALTHETRCIFEYILWTTTHEVTKPGLLIDISNGNNSK